MLFIGHYTFACLHRQRIFLALSNEVKESILHLADSPASVIFDTLKELYEYSGTSAKYYARKDYHNMKINDYNSIGDFITGLTKLAHLVNKTVGDASDCISAPCILSRHC